MSLESIRTKLPSQCQILAVSKLQSFEKVIELHRQGQLHFAENYVQEALEKIQMSENQGLRLQWHLIGHLQTNKVKSVVGRFAWIHSVDSLKLAKALASATPIRDPQKILLQVNVAGEISKGGVSIEETRGAVEQILKWPSLKLMGLMTMPPLSENQEDSRPHFKTLRMLRDELQSLCPTLRELSMGTSGDYQVAAEEGATWVRLGTVLFGERVKT